MEKGIPCVRGTQRFRHKDKVVSSIQYLPHKKIIMEESTSGSRGSSGKSRRGFAAMDADKQREIASKGGRAAHEKGTAHEFTSEEARAAGRKGGQASGGARRRK